MPYPVLPPNPSLVAIILMIKTRAGIHHVFHYPPDPGHDKPHIKLDYENSSEEESIDSSVDGGYSSLEDDRPENDHDATSSRNTNDVDIDESGSASPQKTDIHGWRRPDVSRTGFLGLPSGLQHFLCPDAKAHKKRFEMSIDGRVFLGWPIYSNEDGLWQRKKKKSREAKALMTDVDAKSTSIGNNTYAHERRSSKQLNEELGETTGNDTGVEDHELLSSPEVDESHERVDEYQQNKDMAALSLKEMLNMFHIVFVMNPPPLEYHLRVDEMYDHVVKKFTRALKWEQSRSNFVLDEAQKIRALEGKHGLSLLPFHSILDLLLIRTQESVQQILKHSPLAKAIATAYTSISTSRIAHITLTPHLTFSLQIPIPTSISILPTANDPQLPGLWLTTATSIPPSPFPQPPSNLASHFALLLLSDLPTIMYVSSPPSPFRSSRSVPGDSISTSPPPNTISKLTTLPLSADINTTSSPLTAPLTHYLRASTPTRSFSQIALLTSIPLPEILLLASHLIYWRRARAIPPLHARDTYIVSPNADMRRLAPASAQYARLFPALPPLPKMLALLSGAQPRVFGSLIPSKDHKDAYLAILAWLLRGGWVTQLRTFAWVRVPARFQAAVAAEPQLEQEQAPASSTSHTKAPVHDDKRPASPAGSVSSTQTTVPFPCTPHTTDAAGGLSTSAPTAHAAQQVFRPRLITHPAKASGLESRLLAAIAAELPAEEKEAWETCLKYFNGEHALEKIAAREGWKRKRVEGLRAGWRERGVLLEGRGW
ncbi:Nitrogen permease regulator 3 [Xylographa trunciseda]|nr:Nitrogen permease regulator 3 [Xylographa trunciseda]